MVYASDTKPCDYAVAALHGCGLRDDDFVKAFGKMVKQKLKINSEKTKNWSLTPEELMTEINKGPSQVLYNAIHSTISGSCKKNSYGYFVTPSRLTTTKIWSLASDWESLITKGISPKQAILGLVNHRMTASKEGINYLHKCNHSISYNDVRMQNEACARMVSEKPYNMSSFRKGIPTHSTIDNNEDTVKRSGTTHDTNITKFQLPNEDEVHLPTLGELQNAPVELSGVSTDVPYEVITLGKG